MRKPHYGWIVAGTGVLIVMGALGFGRFGYTVILPAMKEGLSLSEVQAADLATANLAGYLAFSLAGGFLASRFGPRIVISVSLLCAAAGMAATGAATDFHAALAARFVTGIASGGANVPVMGLLSAWFLARRRGLAAGMAVGGSSVGILVTGLALPLVLQEPGGEGWRHAWYLLAALTSAVAVLCVCIVRNRPSDTGARPIGEVDGVGQSEGESPRPPERTRMTEVFRTRALWSLAFVYVLFGFSYIVYSTFFVRFLTREEGFGMNAAAALWSLIGASSIASGFLWGWVSDRLGRKYGLALVFLLQSLSFAAMGSRSGKAGIYASSLLFALTAWSIPAIVAAAAGDLLGPRLAPAGLGLLTLFFGIGQVLGPFAAGRIAQTAGSYAPSFLVAAAAAFTGALLSFADARLRGGRPHHRGRP